MFRKEMWEAFGNSRSRNQMLASLIIVVVLADILLPLMDRDYQVSLGRVLFFGAMFSIMTPLFSTADSVAGERERHTLETLLSTRLSDRSIVLGKLLSVLVLGVSIAAGMILQGLVVICLLFGRWDLFPLFLALTPAVLAGTVLVSIALSCVGLLVSMRAQTVQGAAQVTSLLAMPVLLVFFLGPAAFTVLVATQSGSSALAQRPEELLIFIGVTALVGIILLDVVLTWITIAVFKRPRLMPK